MKTNNLTKNKKGISKELLNYILWGIFLLVAIIILGFLYKTLNS
jgi:hypothetical protein